MPVDDLLEQVRIVRGHRHVVEKEQRLGPAADGVVDAHRHQVDADRVVPADHLGDLQLRAHAVGAGDQHRLAVIAGEQPAGEVELEQPGEAAVLAATPAGNGSAASAAAAATSTPRRSPGRRRNLCK